MTPSNKSRVLKEDERADAVIEFAAWLTQRKEPVTFSGRHHAGPAADLMTEFNSSKGWQPTFKWLHGKSKFRHFLEWQWFKLKLKIKGAEKCS